MHGIRDVLIKRYLCPEINAERYCFKFTKHINRQWFFSVLFRYLENK
jgi:hypothetical protein